MGALDVYAKSTVKASIGLTSDWGHRGKVAKQEGRRFPIFFQGNLGLVVSNMFVCSPLFGEDEPILTHIFQRGLKPPTRNLGLMKYIIWPV